MDFQTAPLDTYYAQASTTSAYVQRIGTCGQPATLISTIQGERNTSPLEDQRVIIEGVVSLLTPKLGGFFIQEETKDWDGNEKTSEGIFVDYDQSYPTVGSVVRVQGTVIEDFEQTVLKASRISDRCGDAEVKYTELSLPYPQRGTLEALEGMAISMPQTLTVVSTYALGRYGEILLADDLLYTPSQLHSPDSNEYQALRNENQRSTIILDDLSAKTPTTPAHFSQLSADNTLRIGSKVSGVKGIMSYAFGQYRIRPSAQTQFIPAPRPAPLDVKGDIKLASFNVLNLFNGDGNGGGFPTDRGADTPAEFKLQQAKIVNALLTIDAAVVGLNELENDGYDSSSAIAQLVNALNQDAGENRYAFIGSGHPIGTASIANGIIYQPHKVTPIGPMQALTEANSMRDSNGPLFITRKNRPALTQKFLVNGTDNTFVVNVNHLKSKGSPCGKGDDSKQQGNCNGTRTRAAIALADFLNTAYAGENIFILGDLNAYAKEDPIRTLTEAGFSNLAQAFVGPTSYSYSFRGRLGTLDYILANAKGRQYVVDAKEWYINAAEPMALDYNHKFHRTDVIKPEGLRRDNVFRSSDHDPIIIGLSF